MRLDHESQKPATFSIMLHNTVLSCWAVPGVYRQSPNTINQQIESNHTLHVWNRRNYILHKFAYNYYTYACWGAPQLDAYLNLENILLNSYKILMSTFWRSIRGILLLCIVLIFVTVQGVVLLSLGVFMYFLQTCSVL